LCGEGALHCRNPVPLHELQERWIDKVEPPASGRRPKEIVWLTVTHEHLAGQGGDHAAARWPAVCATT
jgi:hypothetical protein